MRRQHVDICDVSRTGCRVENSQRLAVGTIVMLTVDIDGRRLVELFRVSRSGGLPGADQPHETGLEFLPMPADMVSLHDIVAQLDQSDAT